MDKYISPSQKKFEKVASRFYTTEEDRLAKLARDKIFVDEFVSAMMPHIRFLYNSSMRFYIFKINTSQEPFTMQAGLFPCCGVEMEIPESIRKMTEDEITTKTRFKRIIWEDLL